MINREGLATTTRFGWKALLATAGILLVGSLVVLLVTEGTQPRMLAVVAIALVGVILVRFSPQMAVQALAVAALAFVFINSSFLIVALRSPASPGDFILAVVSAVSTVTILVSALPTYRGAAETEREATPSLSSTPLIVGIVAGSVVLLTSTLSLYSTITFEDAKPREGDVLLDTRSLSFVPPRLIAREGSVGIHVTNYDETLHTLTVPSLGIDLSILPGKAVRTQFRAKSGTYPFSCRRHPQMTGEIFLRKPGASDIEDFIGSGAGG